MSQQYRTRQGDTVDYIAWKYYGRQNGTAEAILEANPGLATRGPVLAENIIITLPDMSDPPQGETIRMWS